MTRSFFSFIVLSFVLGAAFVTGCSSKTEGRGIVSDGGLDGIDSSAPPGASYRTNCINYTGSVGGCGCTYGSGSSNTECDTITEPTALCCADVGWPDTNLTCQCTPYTCKLQNGTGTDSCQCGAYESGNLAKCTDAVCCASTDTDECHCGPSITCNSYETQVTQCSSKVANCGGTTLVAVSACSQ